MNKLTDLIKNNWLRNTTKTVLLIVIIISLFIGINYFVQKLDLKTLDLTENKLYSLTDESKEKIKDISKEVNIFFFGYEEDNSSVDLAKQYSRENNNINVKVANISDDSDLYSKYGVSDDDQGVVVACEDKSRILSNDEFSTYDYSTYEQIDTTEQVLTSAILNIITDEKPQVYFLTGHSEKLSKLSTFQIFLQNEVNDVNTLDLISSDFPENCDCLILTTPNTDYSQFEVEKIKNYINNGGNILCLIDSYSKDFTNLNNILSLYGVSVSNTVKETDSSKTASGDSRYIIPNMVNHKITEYISTDGALMFIESSKLDLAQDTDLQELNVESNILVESSDTSYLTESTETKGPFTLGVELTKKLSDSDNLSSTLIIYSNSKFAEDSATIGNQSVIPFSIYSNKDLLLNSVSYLTQKDSSIVVRKNTNTVTYTATDLQNKIVLIIIFLIPFVIIIIGIIMGIYRKRKK